MKRILPTIIVCLLLSGCAAFAQYRNPIGIAELAQIESGYGIMLSGAVAYRKACNDRVIARTTCAPVVDKLQAADRIVQLTIKEASSFVRKHPTVSAVDLIQGVKSAVSIFQQIAKSNGVN